MCSPPDGQPYAADPRGILRQTMALAEAKGLTVRIGSECEFYLFEADERGGITTRPHDRAGYLDVSPRSTVGRMCAARSA